MSPIVIASLVEGHGEVEALPVLIRRVAALVAPGVAVQALRPHRHSRGKLVREGELQRCGLVALANSPEAHLLVLLDADDDCPAELGPQFLEWIKPLRPSRTAVVVATREYETWFLASAESLRGRRGPPETLKPAADPEGIRGAKDRIKRSTLRRSYSPMADQAALTDGIDIDLARRRSDSFDKLCRVLEGWLQRR